MTDHQRPDWAEGMQGSPFASGHFTKQLQHQVLRKAQESSKQRRRFPARSAMIASFILAALVAGLWLLGDRIALLPSSLLPGTASHKPTGERNQYFDNGKLVYSVFPDPELKAGRPSGYIFSFEAPFEELQGKTLAIEAEHVHSGQKVTAVAPAIVTEPSGGYPGLQRFGVRFGLPLSGLWRYVVKLDGNPYGDVLLSVQEPSWEPSPMFKSGSYEMRGIEQSVGFIDAGFKAGAPQKYMWHFWGRDGELDGAFVVKAVKQGEERIVDVFSSETLGGAINGADRNAVSMMSLPEKGRWRLLPYVGDRMLESIVVEVK